MATVDSPARSPASQQRSNSSSSGAAGGGDESYPPQLHAGAVGLGPEYGKGASTGDKVQGYKEEMKGKMFHKPDLVQHGHDLRTGELKKKQMDDDANPFNPGGGHDKNTESEHEQAQAATTAPEGTAKSERQTEGENTDRVEHIG